jgi:hypothetical protein
MDETRVVKAVVDAVAYSRYKTNDVRNQWRLNFETFVGGSKFEGKADWQSDFSVNEIGSSVRTCAGGIRSNFLRRPDWFEVNGLTTESQKYEKVVDKALRFYLDRANFRRRSSTFLLMACISLGIMRVGWQFQRVRNPRKAFEEGDKQAERFDKAVAKSVENPRAPAFEPSEEGMDQAFAEFLSLATDSTPAPRKTPEFVQRGGLELKPLNPENFFWDPSSDYMEDSSWLAYEDYIPLWRLRELEDLKLIKNVSEIVPLPPTQDKTSQDFRNKNISPAPNATDANMVKVTELIGTVVYDNEIIMTDAYVVIANDKICLKVSGNPYWGDVNGKPYVMAAAHEIPFRPSGAGIGDNAIGLQRVLDSNYQLMTDQMRLGIVGINFVDRTRLISPDSLQEGLAPGKIYETNQDPDKVFKHVNITSNIENQVFPMNEVLRQGIQKATGVNALVGGGPSMRSRTSATEISTQAQGSEGHIYTISEDLEIQFLIPFLQKCIARVLQFGLDLTDPEFAAKFDDYEQDQIRELRKQARDLNFSQLYGFNIKGFGAEVKRLDEIQRMNELLALYNTGGLVAQSLNGPQLMKDLVDRMGFRDPSAYVLDNTELEAIFAENRLLGMNQYVAVSEYNNHELHIQQHQKAMLFPNGNTEAAQAHLQEHLMKLQQLQLLKQAQQAAIDNPTGLSPQRTTGADNRNEPMQ